MSKPRNRPLTLDAYFNAPKSSMRQIAREMRKDAEKRKLDGIAGMLAEIRRERKIKNT